MRSRGSSLPREVCRSWALGRRPGDLGEQAAQGVDLFEHGRAVAGELRRTRVDLGVQGSHVRPSLMLSGFR
jgi:hypothetical protein